MRWFLSCTGLTRETGFADEDLAAFEMPVLLFAGERDDERLADSKAASAILPNSQTNVIPEGDHLTTLTHVDEILALAREFLGRPAAGRKVANLGS